MDRLVQIKKERERRRRNSTALVGKQGRIVIPAEVRKQLGIKEGDVLSLWVENGRLNLATSGYLEAALEAFRKGIPEGASLVDDLLQERRREFLKEEKEWRESLSSPRDVSLDS